MPRSYPRNGAPREFSLGGEQMLAEVVREEAKERVKQAVYNAGRGGGEVEIPAPGRFGLPARMGSANR